MNAQVTGQNGHHIDTVGVDPDRTVQYRHHILMIYISTTYIHGLTSFHFRERYSRPLQTMSEQPPNANAHDALAVGFVVDCPGCVEVAQALLLRPAPLLALIGRGTSLSCPDSPDGVRREMSDYA